MFLHIINEVYFNLEISRMKELLFSITNKLAHTVIFPESFQKLYKNAKYIINKMSFERLSKINLKTGFVIRLGVVDLTQRHLETSHFNTILFVVYL